MGSALWIAVSGLNASSKEMDVIGNNVANANTTGYKTGKTCFANVLSESLYGGATGVMQIGQGVAVADVATQFSQGSFESTSSGLDLAIDGDGFFIVEDAEGAQAYTRAGAFHTDEEGYLVDVNDYRVQGYAPHTTTLGDINLRNAQSQPAMTTSFSAGMNLDATTAQNGTFNSSQTIYDSLGAAHSLVLTYTKTATAGEWNVSATLDGVAATVANPVLQFGTDGSLQSPADRLVSFAPLSNGATLASVTWDMTSSDAETITGYASTSAVQSLTNDGYPSGALRSLSIQADGTISGSFTNGQTATLGQITLADFANPGGLQKTGSNLYISTLTSGQAIVNTPGAGGLGDVKANSLEMSNTDIATEFINMITAQRAYQASAKVITTTDDMMTALMNTKR